MPVLPAASGWTVDSLAATEAFNLCLTQTAAALIAGHREIPQEVRYLANIQKWTLSQAGLLLHFRHRLDPAQPMLSPAQLRQLLAGSGIASRNTITGFLHGMEKYGLIARSPGTDARQNCYVGTPRVEGLITLWMQSHLTALDSVDGGDRAATLQANPALVAQIQPRMAAALITNPDWITPPEGIALFTRAESGSNILHYVLPRAPWQPEADYIPIGPLTAQEIAENFLISASHIARILAEAETSGLLVWDKPGRRGECRANARLIGDYRRWQALKFIALEKAMIAARAALPG